MIEQVSTAQMLASKPLFPNKIIGTIQKSQICFLILNSTKLQLTHYLYDTKNKFVFSSWVRPNNKKQPFCIMLEPQLEWNGWLSIASSDWKFETFVTKPCANIEIVTEIKKTFDARKSRDWYQWAWGNPRDKKDIDTAHCSRPLCLYFVTLRFLVCIQSYVTLSTIVFRNSLTSLCLCAKAKSQLDSINGLLTNAW